jgi:hypothetical protein
VSPVIVLDDQAYEGNDDATVRRVESDRCLAGRQTVVEAARVDSKKLGKESESIASEGLKGHWVIGIRQPGDGETERRTEGGKMLRFGMKVKIIERMQTYIHRM